MKEIWADVGGYEGIYKVSNFGNILSEGFHFKNNRGLDCYRKPRLLKKQLNRDGYVTTILTRGKTFKNVKAHRLVALAFLGNPPAGRGQVNHKNGIKDDNRVENLEWVSGYENIQHSFKSGLHGSRKGSNSNRAKLDEAKVLEIRRLLEEGANKNYLAKIYGVTEGCIGFIHKRKSWSHI